MRGPLHRLRGVRWIGAGLADQVVIAVANAGNTLLGLILLDREAAGLMVLALGVAYLAMYINRALVGDVLLALASRYDGERRDRLVRNALSTAVVIGTGSAVVFVVVWAAWPTGGKFDLRDLIWITPFLPLIFLHDTARFSHLADRRPERALVIDLVWVGAQAVSVAVLLAAGVRSAAGLLVAWGLGAAAGATVHLVRTKANPLRGDPRQWIAETRHLSGWFTVTAIVGQLQVQAVGFIVAGQLSLREVSGLRLAQTVLIQPVQNLITAVQGLVVPRASRLAGEALSTPAAAVRLRRQIRLLAIAFAGLGTIMVLVVWPLGSFVLVRTEKFADVAPLALPMSLQGAIYLTQLPFTAALRAMHRARMLFVQYIAFSATSITGLLIGARYDLLGAAWGLTVGAAVGLVVMIGLYWYSLRYLGDRTAEPFPEATPSAVDAAVTAPPAP